MNRHIFILLIFITLLNSLKAQQDAYYSLFSFNAFTFNPGAAGNYEMVCLTGIQRLQWMKFIGAPRITDFNAHLPFSIGKTSHGAGLAFKQDIVGFEQRGNLNLAYAYRIPVGNGKLSLGLNGGLFFNKFDANWIYPSSGNNINSSAITTSPPASTGTSADPAVPLGSNDNSNVFDMGIGLFYKTDNLWAGFSSTHLNQARFNFSSGNVYLVRHYHITSGYLLKITNSPLTLNPSFLLTTDGTTNRLIMSSIVFFKDKFWGGLSYRLGNAIVAMLGLELFKDVQFGVAYDYETTKIRRYTSGSVEVMLRYSFELFKERFPERYKSIRYL